jgi:hypothetical protein
LKKGEDDVVLCQVNNDVQNIHHYHNPSIESGQKTILLDVQNPSLGLSDLRISIDDNILTCGLSRKNKIANNENYFDASKMKYHLLFAYGENDQESILFENLF